MARGVPSAEFLARAALRYLDNSMALSREKDGQPKAGEMLWGAVVLAAKAAAAVRGRRLTRYGHVKEFVRRLAKDLADPWLSNVFDATESLHGRFYEAHLDPADLAIRQEEATRWVARVLDLAGLHPEADSV